MVRVNSVMECWNRALNFKLYHFTTKKKYSRIGIFFLFFSVKIKSPRWGNLPISGKSGKDMYIYSYKVVISVVIVWETCGNLWDFRNYKSVPYLGHCPIVACNARLEDWRIKCEAIDS